MSLQCRSCAGTAPSRRSSIWAICCLPTRWSRLEALDEPEARYPLRVVFCMNCSLVQITETRAAERLCSQITYISPRFRIRLLASAQVLLRSASLRSAGSLGNNSLVMEAALKRRLSPAALSRLRHTGSRHRAGGQHRQDRRAQRRTDAPRIFWPRRG